LAAILLLEVTAFASDLPNKRYLDLDHIKIMVSAAEAKAKELNVSVTICVVDESGNLLFLEKGETASLNTIQFAQRKARHAAFYGKPSKEGADTIKKGNTEAMAFPEFFPNQGGLPINVNGQLLGGISASGAKSEIDEAIAQSALDALLKQ
jgi:glc operon protein GlcG